MTIKELQSRFHKIEKIKKGGQKIVYKALDCNDNTVALKIISDESDPRVLQEIEIVQKLSIDNVPKILETGLAFDESINENVLYIIEEYIDGISLRDWLNLNNTANLSFAYTLLYTLVSIEIILEENKILHRDINPNNIILESSGKIYLIDFGLAKNLSGASLTQTAALHGPFTPGYAPHEQFANLKLQQDVRTDLFQIGVTIYECCTGKNPFIIPNDTLMDIMNKTMTLVLPPLNLEGDTKGAFAQLIGMLVAKNQSQRPDTASDAMRYLKAITPMLIMKE